MHLIDPSHNVHKIRTTQELLDVQWHLEEIWAFSENERLSQLARSIMFFSDNRTRFPLDELVTPYTAPNDLH